MPPRSPAQPAECDPVRRAIQEIAARAARAAQEAAERDPPPSPPPRPQEAEDRGEEAPAPIPRVEREAGDVRVREGARARLRRLLADGRWHDAPELLAVAGMRFGARLYELRHGADGEPTLEVEGEPYAHDGRTCWRYRLAPGPGGGA